MGETSSLDTDMVAGGGRLGCGDGWGYSTVQYGVSLYVTKKGGGGGVFCFFSYGLHRGDADASLKLS